MRATSTEKEIFIFFRERMFLFCLFRQMKFMRLLCLYGSTAVRLVLVCLRYWSEGEKCWEFRGKLQQFLTKNVEELLQNFRYFQGILSFMTFKREAWNCHTFSSFPAISTTKIPKINFTHKQSQSSFSTRVWHSNSPQCQVSSFLPGFLQAGNISVYTEFPLWLFRFF